MMNDDEIVSVLQQDGSQLELVAVAELLDRLTDGGLSHGAIVTYFKRAFPSIPLRVLLEAGGWRRAGGRALSDEQFNELLQPWIPR